MQNSEEGGSMALARPFEKCALVMGVLSTAEDRREQLFAQLEAKFGKIAIASPVMAFPYTNYYDGEMGGHPVRYLLLFEPLIDPSTLADIKTWTNALELEYASPEVGDNAISKPQAQGRKINLDPGILSLSSFILATCKDRSHRIPLRDGIYAETTLIFQDKDFQRLPWSYADYCSDDIRAILRSFRDFYRNLLKQAKNLNEN